MEKLWDTGLGFQMYLWIVRVDQEEESLRGEENEWFKKEGQTIQII